MGLIDLPDEFTHSNYTRILKGANAKAKANAAQGLPELLKIAANEVYEDNRKEKHLKDAKNMVGIRMIQDLHFLYSEITEKLKDTMFLMLRCQLGMMRMGNTICTIL